MDKVVNRKQKIEVKERERGSKRGSKKDWERNAYSA